MEFLETAYAPALVGLSVGVAVFASFVSLDVAARIWPAKGWAKGGWIAAAATAMGGGIWSMHFIAMLAFSLPVGIAYDVPLTLASLATAIIMTGFGFVIIAGGRAWPQLLLAGTIMGLGVAAMHYTGMAAMQLPAIIVYTPWLVVLSVAIACLAATAALWIATTERSFVWRASAALVMGVAVCGMHYTGMEAACFSPAPWLHNFGAVRFDRGNLALLVACGATMILGLEFLSALVDRRFAAFRMWEAEILRLSARRFQNLVQSSNDVILVVDRGGRIAFAAPSARSFGCAPTILEGGSIFDLVSGDGVEALRAVLTAEEAHAAFAYVDRLLIRDENGARRSFEATACNLLDEPSVNGIVLTFHDVTDRERTAEELRRAMRVSDEANRLKSQFIANMNHELRTPLNAILGFSEIMATDDAGALAPAIYREYARYIHRSGGQLLAIINDILDFSKCEIGHMTLSESTVLPDQLVEHSLRCIMPAAAKKDLRVSSRIAPDTPAVTADERRLEQILLNLLSNAVKFTPPGGDIAIEVALTAEGELAFSVADTGIGIPADQLLRVAEPFYQVDGSLARQQEGAGLGLAIAKSLAELHGGQLLLSSEPGAGTTARLLLPRTRLSLSAAA